MSNKPPLDKMTPEMLAFRNRLLEMKQLKLEERVHAPAPMGKNYFHMQERFIGWEEALSWVLTQLNVHAKDLPVQINPFDD